MLFRCRYKTLARKESQIFRNSVIIKLVQLQARYMTCHALNRTDDPHFSAIIEACNARSPDETDESVHVTHPLPTAVAAAAKIGASSLSFSSSSSLYIKRSCLPKRRSKDDVTLDRRRSFFPRLSRGSLFHLRIFRGDARARSRMIGRFSIPRDGNCTRTMNGPVGWVAREKQTGKLRGRSRAVDWRASAYPTPLITGRHPTARPPLCRTPAIILHRALICTSLWSSRPRTSFCRMMTNFSKTRLNFPLLSVDTLFGAANDLKWASNEIFTEYIIKIIRYIRYTGC